MMIPVYDVQTFYGTRQKTFQCRYHAEQYCKKLCQTYDADLIEIKRRLLTEEEFIYTDIDD